MGFDAGTSGVLAASADLDVIGNNIANSNTTGFKSSRAEFADVYAASVLGGSSTSTGTGVRLANVAQQFTQGTIGATNNNLDLAINGQGFFRMDDGGSILYTRAGAFTTDQNGYIVNSSNQKLTGYLCDSLGNVTGQVGDLRIDTANIQPSATLQVDGGLNLDATSTAPGTAWTSPTDPSTPPDPSTYNNSTSLTIYDSLGNSHALSLYFVKDAADGTWNVHSLIDGTEVGTGQTVTFDSSGLVSGGSGSWTLPSWTPPNGAAAQAINISLAQSTQFGSAFGVNSLTQDGFTTGQLSGVSIDASGIVFGQYTNGQSKALGQVALANFANPQALQAMGDTCWAETYSSGSALMGAPGTASLGVLQSGALEQSNVDLTKSLVDLIQAQRTFQANAQTIHANDTVMQSILRIQ